MKECTLQEAVELCKKNGGAFKILGWPDSILSHKTLCTYEPPKKSAFQEWNDRCPIRVEPGELESTSLRKQGFNFALDYVLKIAEKCHQSFIIHEIEKLKEP